MQNKLDLNDSAGKSRKLEEYLADNSQEKTDPIFIPTDEQYKPTGLLRFFNGASRIALIFLLGGLGGVWMEHYVIPKMGTMPQFERLSFFKGIKDRTTIINRSETIKISEDTAILDAVRKNNPAAVKIVANYVLQENPPATKKKSATFVPKIKIETRTLTGIILTSDGLVLTRDPKIFSAEALKSYSFKEATYNVSYKENNYTVEGSSNITFFDSLNKTVAADWRNNIVLLRVKANNFPVIALGSSAASEIGEKIILLGSNISSGIISEIRKDDFSSKDLPASASVISTDNYLNQNYVGGGPLVNLKGELLGINIIDAQGKPTNSFVAVDDFKGFIDQVIGR